MRKLVLLFALTACSSFKDDMTTEEALGKVAFSETPQWIDWSNGGGTYRIYKVCLGPDSNQPGYIGHDGSVGPGYVATAWTRDGRIITDDTIVAAHLGLNSGATGLGQFGFHLARGFAPFTMNAQNAFQVTTRFCNANRRPSGWGGYNGFGVRSSKVAEPASVDGNGVGHVAIESVLGDELSDLVRVRWKYVVEANDVKVWITVTTLCANGTCNAQAANGNAFVKEPKVTIGVNPPQPDKLGYQRMTMFGATGVVAQSSASNDSWSNACSSSPNFPSANPRCEWGGQNPVQKTGQCDDDGRTRARFWNGKDCGSDSACLVVAGRSASGELQPSQPWEGASLGLDEWALRSVGRERANSSDSPAGGAKWSCNDSSANAANRRWEMAGYALTPGCSYTNALVSFHGWEGGTGMFDCENLYYRFGPGGESFTVAISFGFQKVVLP